MEIDKIIFKLDFQEEKVYKDKRSDDLYYYAAGFINNRKVFIKIVSKKKFAKRCEYHFKREVYAEEFLKTASEKQGIKIPRLKVLSSGEDQNYLWIIREYKEAEQLCLSKENFFDLNPKFLEYNKKICRGIAQNLRAINKISIDCFDDKYVSRFMDSIDEKKAQELKNLGIDSQKFKEIFQSSDKYFQEKNICLGDLNPRNILVEPDLTSIFYDFEWFSVDHPTIDLAFLWYFLHQYPDWQKSLLLAYRLDEEEKRDFQISLIRVILSVDGGLYKGDSKEVAIKYLIAAGESFEAIMGVK
ncbi:MAG: phosphotransferase [Candidatus Berkelbacteria bacterium]|nr:phosphotransferase [Candidatus Berkelbacteria bacterium]